MVKPSRHKIIAKEAKHLDIITRERFGIAAG